MAIETNIMILCNKLKSEGWTLTAQNKEYLIITNEWTFKEKIELHIPINKKSRAFPLQLETLLYNLIEIDRNFKTLKIVEILFAQTKNIKHKFSKSKKEWILAEPNSKYNINEIPSIYLPKFDIFE